MQILIEKNMIKMKKNQTGLLTSILVMETKEIA